ncbi:MAG: hypothetical protein R3D43_00695 [Tepidamorphaceae bacterium]|nr:hypothetical protein [Rhodobiaceae bacterium]MCC0047761.1 hypothetical protein [Rhodobiaceae bacterium]
MRDRSRDARIKGEIAENVRHGCAHKAADLTPVSLFCIKNLFKSIFYLISENPQEIPRKSPSYLQASTRRHPYLPVSPAGQRMTRRTPANRQEI